MEKNKDEREVNAGSIGKVEKNRDEGFRNIMEPVPGLVEGVTKEIEDCWKHRSKEMRCGRCMFFVLKSSTAIQHKDHMIGRCRESSPTMKGWPAVFSDDWCGAHKLDEDKL